MATGVLVPRRIQPAAPLRARSATLVWSVCACMTAVLFFCIFAYGRNVPLAEDWVLVPSVTGHESHFWQWLWSQNNEHRLPVPRLMLLALVRPLGDFRAGMLASSAMTAAVALASVHALQRARGGVIRPTDAFVPLAFLHLGHWENLLWAWELSFVVSAALVCVLLIAVLAGDVRTSTRASLFVAVVLAMLPLCGATGLVPALPVAVWFLCDAVSHPPRSAAQRIIACGAMTSLCAAAAYFVGYHPAIWNPPSPGLRQTLSTAIKCLALGLGPGALTRPRLWALLAMVVAAACTALLVRAACFEAVEERSRARHLLVVWTGLLGLALAIGWGRAGLVPTVGLPARYGLLMTPVFLLAYIAAELYGSSAVRRVVQTVLLAAACALLPSNTRAGLNWRDWYVAGMTSVERDLAAGVPAPMLAARHERFLYPWNRTTLIDEMKMLRDAGIGPFRRLAGGS